MKIAVIGTGIARLGAGYLSYCEAGFAIRSLRDDPQIVLSRAANDAPPSFPPTRPSF